MNYFEGCNTPEERKRRYRELAKKHHPDITGNDEVMKLINDQYQSGAKKSYTDGGYFYKGREFKSKSWDEEESFSNFFKRHAKDFAETSYSNNHWGDAFRYSWESEKERQRRKAYEEGFYSDKEEQERAERFKKGWDRTFGSTSTEVKGDPCPFCGKSDFYFVESRKFTSVRAVKCRSCGAQGPEQSAERMADKGRFDAWNTRVKK